MHAYVHEYISAHTSNATWYVRTFLNGILCALRASEVSNFVNAEHVNGPYHSYAAHVHDAYKSAAHVRHQVSCFHHEKYIEGVYKPFIVVNGQYLSMSRYFYTFISVQ